MPHIQGMERPNYLNSWMAAQYKNCAAIDSPKRFTSENKEMALLRLYVGNFLPDSL